MGQRLIEKGTWYLAPFSWLYALGVFFRNRLYDWLPVIKVPATVVSVGNILAGGTGKTPLVLLLAQAFPHRKVAILSRGYGGRADEARLLARRLPNVKVYVGKDRAALAQQVDADLIILDDGFQHRRLHRDFDIVLDRESIRHYLPWGFLRDSPQRLKKADAVFTVGKDFTFTVKRILDLHGNEIPSINGWKVALFCGIAQPQNFKKTVEGLGAEIIAETFLADHEAVDLDKLPKVSALLCTEKDFIKLPPTQLPIYYLEMELRVAEGAKRWEKLIEKIDQKIDNGAQL